jgi:tetratricopeptide (TPR) repeat protein
MFYDAETEFKKAISMEPVFVENYIGLSELYKEQGRIGDARRIIARAFELNSKSDEAMACLEPYRDILGRD